MTIKELVEEYEHKLSVKEDAENALTRAKADVAIAEANLCAKLAEEGAESAKLNGYTYTSKDKTYYSMSGDREELFEELRKHDAGSLIRETVSAQTFQAYVTEQADQNFGTPPEWLEGHYTSYTTPKISRRKA